MKGRNKMFNKEVQNTKNERNGGWEKKKGEK